MSNGNEFPYRVEYRKDCACIAGVTATSGRLVFATESDAGRFIGTRHPVSRSGVRWVRQAVEARPTTKKPEDSLVKEKPTIAELEAMIEDGAEPRIAPDGTVTVEHPKVHKLEDILDDTASEIKPALTAEEWKFVSYEYDGSTEVLGGGWGEREHGRANEAVNLLEGGLGYRPGATHGVAAYLLHDQPFGFTWEDVDMLKMSARTVLGAMEHKALLSIADRIEALLPPEEK